MQAVAPSLGWTISPPSDSDYIAIQKEPKAELHIHVGGAFTPEHLLRIATQEQLVQLTEFLEKIKHGVKYEDVFAAFPLISKIVNTNQKLEDGAFYICEALKADGVTVAELRTGLKALDGDEEGYLDALFKGIERAVSPNFRCTVLLSVKRESTPEYVQKTVELAKKYMYRGVVGIDISGDSTKGDIRPHLETLKRARAFGLYITAHIGESYAETDQMEILQELQPHRVGHGACLCLEAIKWIMQRKTPVEVCPTSARLTRMHGPKEVHPWIIEHIKSGHPIVICTDDPTVFGVGITDELYSLKKHGLNLEQIQEIAKSSFTHAFKK